MFWQKPGDAIRITIQEQWYNISRYTAILQVQRYIDFFHIIYSNHSKDTMLSPQVTNTGTEGSTFGINAVFLDKQMKKELSDSKFQILIRLNATENEPTPFNC